mgnify:FL=1
MRLKKKMPYRERIRRFYRRFWWQLWLLAALAAAAIFAFHNEGLYDTPVGKIVKVDTQQSGTATNYNSLSENDSEPVYCQKMTVKILNGRHKGKRVTVAGEHDYTGMDKEAYRRGDKVFLSLSGEDKISSASIKGVKRDQYAVLLAVILAYLVIILGKGRGILSLCSIGMNIVIFLYGLARYEAGDDLMGICVAMIVALTVLTLFLVNGVNRRSLVAILSALATAALTMEIFLLAMEYGGEIDYAALDYVAGGQDLESIFIASVAIAGLGAVMDVAVSIAAALNELILKDPGISVKSLARSGREIGHDIMGTMINVLLFTYICGLIPLMIMKMKNEVSLLTIVRLQIPFEISRFLIGGIGIVLAIPVSIALSSIILKIGRKKT